MHPKYKYADTEFNGVAIARLWDDDEWPVFVLFHDKDTSPELISHLAHELMRRAGAITPGAVGKRVEIETRYWRWTSHFEKVSVLTPAKGRSRGAFYGSCVELCNTRVTHDDFSPLEPFGWPVEWREVSDLGS